MTTKHELAIQIAIALGHGGDDSVIASYQCLPMAEMEVQARELPGVVDRLKAEGQWNSPDPCSLCDEDADDEMGEFWDETAGVSVVAHAQCGLDAGLPLA